MRNLMCPLVVVVVLLLALCMAPAVSAGTLWSPLAGPPAAVAPAPAHNLALALPAPPPVPPPGIYLGWGSSGGGFTGQATFSFTTKWLQPAAVDVFTRGSDAHKTPAIGVGIRASTAAKALGINLTGVWATFASAIRGGFWGSKDGAKWVGGGYYTLDVVGYNF